MKYVDEYRDARRARQLIHEIRRLATRERTLMEVCGGQTHSLLRNGIVDELAGSVELLHGPGCPVCVTPMEAIDLAAEIASRPGFLLASFGDMLRVPGSRGSLLAARARGASVSIVYSPLDALELARRDPHRQVVFFAVGFETTAPASALAVKQAARLGLANFSLLVAHVRVQPAMEAMLESNHHRIQAFLAAGHVCTVVGYESYQEFVRKFRLPVVVTGFEPLDLLAGIRECVRQLEAGESSVQNAYSRSARPEGNPRARDLVREVYEVGDATWRGIGMLREGGLRLRDEWAGFDARRRFGLEPVLPRGAGPGQALPILELPGCRSAEVLTGLLKPNQCAEFGRRCTPENPLGAPMVSSEGACAAYHRYAAHARQADAERVS